MRKKTPQGIIMGEKQHYVSQFYLKNFSDVNQKAIGVFRFDSQKFIRNASIKDIAYRKRFYDDDDSIEKILAEEEGKWKGILDIFLGKNVTTATLTWLQDNGYQYVIDLLKFISITEARTSQHGDALTYIIQIMEERIGNEMLPETYKHYFGGMDEITKHPNIISIQVALDNVPFYAGLDLLVIFNKSRQLFVTSDVPVVNINPYYEKRGYKRNYGIGAMGLQKLIPISGRVCLCLYDRNIYKRHCKETSWILRSKKIVHQLNMLIVENAYEQLFFDTHENEQYIKNLCAQRQISDNKGRIDFFGKERPELIWMHQKPIMSSFLLPCLCIKKSSLSIPLPTHMGGLVRPEVQSLFDEQMKNLADAKFREKGTSM